MVLVLVVFAFIILPVIAALALWVLHLHRRVAWLVELLANEAEHTRALEVAVRHATGMPPATGRHSLYDPSS